jgi:hypothetical protein
LPASKILPKFVNFVFQRRIFFFQLFNHNYFLPLRTNTLTNSAANKIIAHR